MNFQIVLDALVKIFTDIVNFIPNLVNGLIILLAGYLVARLVSSLVGFILRQVKFDFNVADFSRLRAAASGFTITCVSVLTN